MHIRVGIHFFRTHRKVNAVFGKLRIVGIEQREVAGRVPFVIARIVYIHLQPVRAAAPQLIRAECQFASVIALIVPDALIAARGVHPITVHSSVLDFSESDGHIIAQVEFVANFYFRLGQIAILGRRN